MDCKCLEYLLDMVNGERLDTMDPLQACIAESVILFIIHEIEMRYLKDSGEEANLLDVGDFIRVNQRHSMYRKTRRGSDRLLRSMQDVTSELERLRFEADKITSERQAREKEYLPQAQADVRAIGISDTDPDYPVWLDKCLTTLLAPVLARESELQQEYERRKQDYEWITNDFEPVIPGSSDMSFSEGERQ